MYLAEPQWFDGELFRQYWPYMVMLCLWECGLRRSVPAPKLACDRGTHVRATGGFLPLLPAVAAWAFSESSYPLVLFCAGLVYVFLAVTRRAVLRRRRCSRDGQWRLVGPVV